MTLAHVQDWLAATERQVVDPLMDSIADAELADSVPAAKAALELAARRARMLTIRLETMSKKLKEPTDAGV